MVTLQSLSVDDAVTTTGIHQEDDNKDSPLEEEQQHRRTENIFIRFHDGPRETVPPTSAPTTTPLTRDLNFRVCFDDSETGDDTALAGVADVHFVYDIETTNELTREEERKLLNALETAMINGIYDAECQGKRKQRRLVGSIVKRRLEIHSISSGNRDKLNGNCIVTTDEATVCNRYDGSIKVGYTDSGDINSEYKAGNAALRVISTEMSHDMYIDVLNSALGVETQDSNSTEISNSTLVKRISYVGTSFYDVNTSSTTSSNYAMAEGTNASLTTLGKIFLPVMAVLFLGSILIMYLGYRKHQRNKRLARLAVLRAKEDNLYHSRNDRLYRDPFDDDVRALALRSINQDVHRCNKTNCVACMQQLPIQLEEMMTNRKLEDYTHPKVEVVDLNEGCESESVFSGLTGGAKTVGSSVWSTRGRKSNMKQQPKIQVDESVDDSLGRFLDKFYDEPPSVKFVRIDSMPSSVDERESRSTTPDFSLSSSEGYPVTRSKIVDHTGRIRNQLEL